MATEILRERFDEIERLAYGAGLKPYDIHFFEVPTSVIYEVASYGLPTRYSHWSFGRAYTHQKNQGEMGQSKIYELILNNNPSYAFLDTSNTDAINLMICAHCLAHSDYFANNIMFRQAGETNMIDVAKKHAEIIERYRKDYGNDEVDEWLDVALALERHIDVYRGVKRQRYDKRHIRYVERTKEDWEDLHPLKDEEPTIKKTIEGSHLPPQPEKDLVWFLSEYANMEDWQRNIFEIVRRESYYFFPQYKTKIANEGWASYWHAEIMQQYTLGNDNDYGVKDIKYPLTTEEHLDFLACHEKVVQPGMKLKLKVEVDEVDPYTQRKTGKRVKQWNPHIVQNPHLFHYATRINPYYVGFRMFRDIEERWDKYYEEGHYENEWGDKIPVTINGKQKIREVMEEEDDMSFFRNYLTDELADELKLFAYGSPEGYDDNYSFQEEMDRRLDKQAETALGEKEVDEQIIINKTVQVRTKNVKDIISAMAKTRNNYGVPCLVIRRVDSDGTLRLEHLKDDITNIDVHYAEYVLEYIYRAWGRPVEIIRREKDVTRTLKYDQTGFSVDHATSDYPEVVEASDAPSSW